MSTDPLNTLTAPAWKRVGIRPHHGMCVPLFSLRSQKGCGIGEYLDLIPFFDLLKEVGMDTLQLLPLNDTGKESSPYSSISSIALNPIYLSLQALPFLDRYPILKEELSSFVSLNKAHRVDYPAVFDAKMAWLDRYLDQTLEHWINDAAFQAFQKDSPWLEGYATFYALKKVNGWGPWKSWIQEVADPVLVKKAMCLQFFCSEQLKQVRKSADAKGILLMGDIPILVSYDSADVWQFPYLFDPSLTAGAPPDMYNKEGQAWRMPLYNWNILQATDFVFWKQRLEKASLYYHLYRLDHIVGFFRIWAIPDQATAKEGFFVPQDPNSWFPQGQNILTHLTQFSSMLPIGEDLGVVPDMVRDTMKDMGICGTKVIRWERKWHEGASYIAFDQYPVLSLTCVSTHDSEPLTLWWQNNREEVAEYARFKNIPYPSPISEAIRFSILFDSHHTPSLFHVNLINEYLALFTDLVSSDPLEERINLPGVVSPTNWSYRTKSTIEELAQHEPLKRALRKLVGRP